MSKPTYWELLRDPRWQRRRLEIMERANWACQLCGDKKETLNVHHRIYRKGAMPWDYSDTELACLCETCHYAETEVRALIAASMSRLTYFQLGELLGFAEGLEAETQAFVDSQSEGIFLMRGPRQVRGFLKALWSHVVPATIESLLKLESLSTEDIRRLVSRGPII